MTVILVYILLIIIFGDVSKADNFKMLSFSSYMNYIGKGLLFDN